MQIATAFKQVNISSVNSHYWQFGKESIIISVGGTRCSTIVTCTLCCMRSLACWLVFSDAEPDASSPAKLTKPVGLLAAAAALLPVETTLPRLGKGMGSAVGCCRSEEGRAEGGGQHAGTGPSIMELPEVQWVPHRALILK